VKYNRLLDIMASSLIDIQKALKGRIVMTDVNFIKLGFGKNV
jgi:hypothetical protein